MQICSQVHRSQAHLLTQIQVLRHFPLPINSVLLEVYRVNLLKQDLRPFRHSVLPNSVLHPQVPYLLFRKVEDLLQVRPISNRDPRQRDLARILPNLPLQ